LAFSKVITYVYETIHSVLTVYFALLA